jgi:hypothetical protein
MGKYRETLLYTAEPKTTIISQPDTLSLLKPADGDAVISTHIYYFLLSLSLKVQNMRYG